MSLFSKALIVTLAALVSVSFSAPPPQWDSELIFDDFDDIYGDAINRTSMGAIKSYSDKGKFNSGKAGYWYTYSSAGASVANPGDVEVEEGNIETAFDSDAKCMHAKFLIDDNEDYCAIAANLVGENVYVDLSNMTSVTLRAKGSGTIRMYFETEYIADNYDWGHLGYHIDLTASWADITIPVSDLEPAPYSDAEDDGIMWSDCKTGVTALAFEAAADADGDKVDTEFWIDSIVFVGMKYSDIVEPYVPISVKLNAPTRSGSTFSVSNNAISYTIAQPKDVSFSIIDLQGNVVSRLSGNNTTGAHSIALPALTAGNYIIKMNGLNTSVQSVRIVK